MLAEWTSREKKLLLTSCILALLVVSMLISSWVKKEDANQLEFMAQSFSESMGPGGGDVLAKEDGEIGTEQSQQSEAEELLIVDIKGAIHQPYVYEMYANQRVIDVIDQAGGLLENASTDTINLAQKVFDGMVIYIPTKEEVEASQGSASLASLLIQDSNTHSQGVAHPAGKININTATVTELETLPGIGPSRAKAIISYREENGPFATPEELMNISGIGTKIFANVKEEIVVR